MFAGGEGTVEITDSGTIGRYSGNFLLRTQPLWLQQGFAVGILAAPNDVLISEQKSRTYDGLWLREPGLFLHDAMPRAEAYLDRFGSPPNQTE
jgi:hypothetical protein